MLLTAHLINIQNDTDVLYIVRRLTNKLTYYIHIIKLLRVSLYGQQQRHY
jgi:hypothetical protein